MCHSVPKSPKYISTDNYVNKLVDKVIKNIAYQLIDCNITTVATVDGTYRSRSKQITAKLHTKCHTNQNDN